MKLKLYIIGMVLLAIFLAVIYSAMEIPNSEKAKENSNAPEHSPVIDEDWNLERIEFIHYFKQEGRAKSKPDSCYKLMGVKLGNLPVQYIINPQNNYGLTEEFVKQTIFTSAETWDAGTSTELFNDSYETDYSAQYGRLDGKNTLAFGEHKDNNVIAVTSVWFRRSDKSIVEFDMLFNTKFVWGNADENPMVMDLQNIATHELGHAIGLGDTYNSICSEVTMYGYSDYGETKKRTLEAPDIAGLKKLYGN